MTILPVHLDDQVETNWCWASIAAGISNFRRGTALHPCDVAGQVLHATDCCANPGDHDETEELSEVLSDMQLLNGGVVDGALNYSAVSAQIETNGVPAVARIVFLNGLVH